MTVISRKICMVGDFSVGKTSLIRRFVEEKFSDRYLSTVGVKISRKAVEVVPEDATEPKKIQLLIWDLEGHTKFKSIAPSYLQGAKGALIVADVTRGETIERIRDHIDLFLSVNPQGWTIVALNKSDLANADKLAHLRQTVEAKQYERVVSIYLTSAKTGDNVDIIFQEIATLTL
ncbi:Rab family GTPase [Baaleninema simplex]|uniref:Rab family GTPase n=1 Tax=Baaleninema simplex TaxID=2862350 RepID=UPI0004764225|nr:Rab family GTPase [Baaleninema simplex]